MIGKLVSGAIADPGVSDPEIQDAFQRKEEAIRVTALSLLEEDLAREIADSARQQPDRLSGFARQLDRQLVSAGPFKRSDKLKELAAAGILFDPVFSLQPGEVSTEPLRAGSDWLVVRLEEKQPADPAKLDDAGREKLKAEIQGQKKMRAYFDWYLDVLKRANLQKNPVLEK